MTVAELRLSVANLDEAELRHEYETYSTLQARSVRDEIMLTLLEDELYNRTLVELNTD